MRVTFLVLMAAWLWGSPGWGHPLQPEGKSGFKTFQAMQVEPEGEPKLVVGVAASPQPGLEESLPWLRQQAAELIKIAEDLGIQISPGGAAMKVLSSGW